MADSAILDLVNSILVEAKEEARANVVEAIKEGGDGSCEVVCVNGLGSPWGALMGVRFRKPNNGRYGRGVVSMGLFRAVMRLCGNDGGGMQRIKQRLHLTDASQ